MATKKAPTKNTTKTTTKTATKGAGADSTDGVKITVRKETNAVHIFTLSDEFLLYKVTAQGGTPLFSLKDSITNLLIMSSKDAPNPPGTGTFQREWPRAGDQVSPVSSHTLGLHFLATIKYTYRVEHRVRNNDGGSDLKALIIDIDYESQAPTETEFQRLGVTLD